MAVQLFILITLLKFIDWKDTNPPLNSGNNPPLETIITIMTKLINLSNGPTWSVTVRSKYLIELKPIC